MDDETIITHLLNSLPQVEYKGVILVIKERLRGSTCDLAQVEQLLEDKYLSMKFEKGWKEEEDDYALFASPAKKKGLKNSSKADVVIGERLDIRQQTALTRKARKITEVRILQGIYPLKDEWVFGCSLKTRLADQTKTQQLKWLWSKDSMNATINQRLVEQTQEMNFKLEGSGGSILDDTLRKQYLSSSDE